MFYENHCETDAEKAVFKALLELSKRSCFIAIQELDYLGLPKEELQDSLMKFEKYGLFKNVQHLGEKYPVIFSLQALD